MAAAETILELASTRAHLLERHRRARKRGDGEEADRLSGRACEIEERMMAMLATSIREVLAQIAVLREHAEFDDLGPRDVPMFDTIIAALTRLADREAPAQPRFGAA